MPTLLPSLPQFIGTQPRIKRSPLPQLQGPISTTCTANITLPQPNVYYPEFPKCVWTNCCEIDGQDLDTSQCQPVETHDASCPDNYYSCADSTWHMEMCTAEQFDSHDGSGVFGYGSTSRTLQQKCCPGGHSCGGSFDAPCIFIYGENTRTGSAVLTNPMYVRKIGVYPGCDENSITPAAVGVIVAVVIVSMCVLGGFCFWGVRKRLYRNPIRSSAQRKSDGVLDQQSPKGKDVEYGESDSGTVDSSRGCESVKMMEGPKKEHRGIHFHGRKHGSQEFEMSRRHGDFNTVHLDPQLATRVLDFAGITVTHEIQIVREDGISGSVAGRAESGGGSSYSISSRSAASTGQHGYKASPKGLVRQPEQVHARPISADSTASPKSWSLNSLPY